MDLTMHEYIELIFSGLRCEAIDLSEAEELIQDVVEGQVKHIEDLKDIVHIYREMFPEDE